MTPVQFKEIEADMDLTHAQMAEKIGVSEVSVKRMATGTQVITNQTERLLVAVILLEREGLQKKYERLLRKHQSAVTAGSR